MGEDPTALLQLLLERMEERALLSDKNIAK